MEYPANRTGLPGDSEPSVVSDEVRPLSMNWIADDLLRATIEAWSPRYGRTVTMDEAVEILMNLKRLSEAQRDRSENA